MFYQFSCIISTPNILVSDSSVCPRSISNIIQRSEQNQRNAAQTAAFHGWMDRSLQWMATTPDEGLHDPSFSPQATWVCLLHLVTHINTEIKSLVYFDILWFTFFRYGEKNKLIFPMPGEWLCVVLRNNMYMWSPNKVFLYLVAPEKKCLDDQTLATFQLNRFASSITHWSLGMSLKMMWETCSCGMSFNSRISCSETWARNSRDDLHPSTLSCSTYNGQHAFHSRKRLKLSIHVESYNPHSHEVKNKKTQSTHNSQHVKAYLEASRHRLFNYLDKCKLDMGESL